MSCINRNYPFTLLLILLFLNSQLGDGRRVRRVSKREQEALDKEHRNAICCEKKMRCCMKPKPPPIEIRAILARCPNVGTEGRGSITRLLSKPAIQANEHSLKTFQGFDEDEPLVQSRVTQCRRKVLLTLKLHHKGQVNSKNQYIVIDHVYDPITERSVRLLNPYVIKLKQEPVSKSFHLKFIDYVNSEAYEKIYNKHDGNYTGCFTDKTHSTCGLVRYEGKVIPFSQGFCCSCDASINSERQPESINSKNEAIISYSDPAYLLDKIQCPRNYYKTEMEDEISKPTINYGDTVPTPPCNLKNKITCGTTVPQVTPGCGGNEKSGNYLKIKRRNEATTFHPLHHNAYYTDIVNISQTNQRWHYTTYAPKDLPIASETSNLHSYLVPKNKRQEDPQEQFEELFNGPDDDPKVIDKYLHKLDEHNKKKNREEYMDDVKRHHSMHQMQEFINQINERFGEDSLFGKRLIRKMRQTFPSGVQKRGGQNCADRYTPPGLDPDHYHESTHCLRFSDVWYGIYKLGDPFIEQNILVNIYERFETETSTDKWREITNGTVNLGNRNPLYEDEIPTISMKFSTETSPGQSNLAKLHHKRILIPEGIKKCDLYKYPEAKNGPSEYLVVDPEQIAIEGDQCDRIGVGFEAFFKQPQRCAVPRSTCLRNQPKHLWRHDKAMEKRNKKGCYYLKYHANITDDPIIVNKTTGEKYLDVEFRGYHISTIDIEIKADFNSVIRAQTSAVITEVYIDSTCEKMTIVTVKVINAGLISNKFMVQLSDFPLDFPASFNRIKSKITLIPPQNQQVFTLEIRHPLPSDLVFCTVEVLNPNHELVALRRIRIQKFDRCICTWHCLCACVASSTGLKCNPMSLEQYHAAGYLGALPIVTYMVHFTLLDDLISVMFYFGLYLLAVLLLMGVLKGILGLCCCYEVGMWGLPLLLDLPKPMKHYYEPSIRKHKVVYDKDGWPIHPKTKRPVRNISRTTEFCTNMVFFFTYPLAGCMIVFKRLCCPYYTKSGKEPQPKQKKADKKKPPKKDSASGRSTTSVSSKSSKPSKKSKSLSKSKSKYSKDEPKEKKSKKCTCPKSGKMDTTVALLSSSLPYFRSRSTDRRKKKCCDCGRSSCASCCRRRSKERRSRSVMKSEKKCKCKHPKPLKQRKSTSRSPCSTCCDKFGKFRDRSPSKRRSRSRSCSTCCKKKERKQKESKCTKKTCTQRKSSRRSCSCSSCCRDKKTRSSTRRSSQYSKSSSQSRSCSCSSCRSRTSTGSKTSKSRKSRTTRTSKTRSKSCSSCCKKGKSRPKRVSMSSSSKSYSKSETPFTIYPDSCTGRRSVSTARDSFRCPATEFLGECKGAPSSMLRPKSM